MNQKVLKGNAAVKSSEPTVRITSARLFHRGTAKKIGLVPQTQEDPLFSKEEDCCSRATD
jgi:hypothetical protein